ncbi:MAG: pyridoxamine 5'-phosphate oxidase, partial [Acidimicrobiales bacterium]
TGPAELIGPADPAEGIDDDGVRRLLREIFVAAGGTHDDFDEFDRVMAEDGRTAILVAPDRIIGNAPSS